VRKVLGIMPRLGQNTARPVGTGAPESLTMALERRKTMTLETKVTPISGDYDTVARPLQKGRCATCSGKLGCVDRVLGKRFCSPECDDRYYNAMNTVAVLRLRPYRTAAARSLVLELAS
jgi:hypothetical protein